MSCKHVYHPVIIRIVGWLLRCRPGSPRASNAERYSLMRRLTVTAAVQAGVAQGQQRGALLPHAAADSDGAGRGHPGAVL